MSAIEDRKQISMPREGSIDDMAHEAYWNSDVHGFHDPHPPSFAEMIALIHSEASEALEEDRGNKGLYYEREDGKPMGIGPELADILIRTAHLAYLKGINLSLMVTKVQAFNRTRPHKHGKKY